MFTVKVPATTANMGPGFDCIGMSLDLYNTITIEEIPQGLEIIIKNPQDIEIPTDETNLIYQTIVQFYQSIGKTVPGIRLVQEDHIPCTRGLGSSAACIAAGLLIANKLAGTNYSKEKLAKLGAIMEGHPDNIVPAFLGGMVTAVLDKDELHYIKIPLPSQLSFALLVPDFPLSTEKARQVIPKSLSLEDGIYNASRTALLVASMMSGEIQHLQVAMEDRFHQPYRIPLVPHMEDIFEKALSLGAKGVFLSGAGPTLIAVIEEEMNFKKKITPFLQQLPRRWDIKIVKPSQQGAQIQEFH
ncbi:MAG: homoserine kinase [Epulopiscium sp.]|nr:homoserine kinase [Candidatus Epulonipiscium sp.]